MEVTKRIRLKVASPCSADWNSMKGDDAVRHCGSCKKNVYQLSNMTTAQVEALLADSKGGTCGRFYQRKDGTLMTADCAVGLRRKRRKLAVVGAGMSVLSAFGVAMAGGFPAASDHEETTPEPALATPDQPVTFRPAPPVEPEVVPEPIEEYELIMGDMMIEPDELPEPVENE